MTAKNNYLLFVSLTGAGYSLWSEESIAWLKCKVSGTKLRAYPTRVECSKLVIVDLFVFPPRNPKHKSPVSSSAGKGLPALQYSITEMMIAAGMAQRIMPQVKDVSSGSSSLSGGSNESISRSCSTVSIESTVQEGDACVEKCDTASCKEDSACTDNSCSSKETVILKPAEKKEECTKVNKETVSGRKNCKDATFRKDNVTDKQLNSAPGSALEEKHFEHSKDLQDVKPTGK